MPGALAGLVVAADVEHHLVAVDVRVVVRHRDRQRVVVDLARQEVADHEVVALEDLVHRRRLVHLAGDRHVVVDVERVGVEAAVPADHVERVGRVGHPGADDAGAGAVLDQHLDVVALGEERLGRAVQVALAVRRVLEELPVAGQVALRRRDVAVRLDRVELARLRRAPSGAWSPAARSRSRRCGSSARRTRSRRCRSRTRRRRTRRRSRCGSTATGRAGDDVRRSGRRCCRAPAGDR